LTPADSPGKICPTWRAGGLYLGKGISQNRKKKCKAKYFNIYIYFFNTFIYLFLFIFFISSFSSFSLFYLFYKGLI